MNANFVVHVQLTDRTGMPLELDNVSIDAETYMRGRVRYRFQVGVTDFRGQLIVTFDQLEKARLDNQAMSIMDYNTLLQDCDPQLGILAPTFDELQQRHTAIQKWYPNDIVASRQIEVSNNGRVACEAVCVDVNIKAEAEVLLVCEQSGLKQ